MTPAPWYAVRTEHAGPQPYCSRIDIRGNPIKSPAGKVIASEPICTLHSGFVNFEANAKAILSLPDVVAEVARLRETLSRWGIDPDTGRAIAEESGMRCSLAGTASQASECIIGMAAWIAEHEGFSFDPEQDGDAPSPECFEDLQPLYYASGLEMISEHAAGLMRGEHTVAEFVDFYALLPGPLQCQRRMPRVEDKK